MKECWTKSRRKGFKTYYQTLAKIRDPINLDRVNNI